MPVSNHYADSLETFICSDNHTITYLDRGKGDPILLLHGVPTSSYLFRKMIPELVKAGYRVLAPDLLGYGQSDKPPGYEVYSHHNQAKRIIELMQRLKISSWVHLCHDMGGLVTWEIAKTKADSINRLYLLNTLILQEGFHPPIRMRRNPITKGYAKLYSSVLTGQMMIRATFKNGLDRFSLTRQDIRNYARPFRMGASHALFYFFSKTGKPLENYAKILKKIKAPVIIIWGKNDKMLRWEDQSGKVRSYLNLKPDQIHMLNSNHFVPEETPLEIVRIISG